MARAAFLKLISLMGYGTAKQYAGRRAFAMYSNLCVPRPDEERAFWKDGVYRFIIIGRLSVPCCRHSDGSFAFGAFTSNQGWTAPVHCEAVRMNIYFYVFASGRPLNLSAVVQPQKCTILTC